MKPNRRIKSAPVLLAFAVVIVCLSCPGPVKAQDFTPHSSAPQAAPAPAYTPPLDQPIYFRPGPKERSVGVTATNSNYPGLPVNLRYLKQTIEALEDAGYDVPEDMSRSAVQVRATAKYTQMDNSQRVANNVVSNAVGGAVLGALTGLAFGGGGQGAAQGAAGGAAGGAAYGAATQPPVLRYLTVEFEIWSRAGGTQTGRVTKDITTLDMGPEEFIDAVIADYVEAALPKR